MRRKLLPDSLVHQEIDLTSLLDVIFILLVFTMLAVQFEAIKTLDLDLAVVESQGTSSMPNDSQTVQLYSDGRIKWNDTLLTDIEFEKKIFEKSYSQKNWNLLSEKKVEYDNFIRILLMIQKTSPATIELGIKEKK